MVIKRNYEFAVGETWTFELACTDPDGQPLNIEGGTVEFRVANATALLADLSLPATGAAFAQGKAIMTVAAADQASVVPGVLSYEARARLPDGRVFDQLVGTITARASLFRQFPYSTDDVVTGGIGLTSSLSTDGLANH